MERCNLCGASETERLLTLPGEGRHLERCTRCSLVFKNIAERRRINASHETREIAKDLSPDFIENYTLFFEQFFKKLMLKPGRLLDVGCGPGLFLSIAKKKGWDAHGIDTSRRSVTTAKSLYGLSIVEGKMEEVSFGEESFDLVTFWHVLDALADPRDALQKTFRYLKKGGTLLVRVNNFRFVYTTYRLWRALKLDKKTSEPPIVFHGYNFTERTLRRILAGSGFQDIVIRNSPAPPAPRISPLRASQKR